MGKNYFLFENYHYETLCDVISKKIGVQFDQVNNKSQLHNLDKILSFKHKQDDVSVLIEYEYVDSIYLRDFENYYGGCFHDYPRKTSRIHFFSKSYTRKDIDNFISGHDSKELQESYLGYLVINPIPDSFIGRSCFDPKKLNLKQQENINCIQIKESVHLFGIYLDIEGSPFIEQDKVTSACASSSLWVMFRLLSGNQSQYNALSPSQITQLAQSSSPKEHLEARTSGLNWDMMARAISTLGYGFHLQKEASLKTIKLYLDAGFPVLLGLQLESTSSTNPSTHYHAVCVIGYGLSENKEVYIVHDDRKGMYMMATIDGSSYSYIDDNETGYEYKTVAILTGFDKSIRSSKETVETICNLFAADVKKHMLLVVPDAAFNFDIQLSLKSNTALKSEYRSSHITKKVEILTSNWPKFLWIADFKIKNNTVFSLLFDTSDLDYGVLFIDCIYANDKSHKMMMDFISNLKQDIETLKDNYINPEEKLDLTEVTINTYLRFIDRILFPSNDKESTLTKLFGYPKPPTSFHTAEILKKIKRTQTPVFEFPVIFEEQTTDCFVISDNLKLEINTSYIYAIDEYGDLIIGKDILSEDHQGGKLGHPSLKRNLWARTAGDLKYNTDSNNWCINIYSGRYKKSESEESMHHLNNVAKLLSILLKQKVDIDIDNYVESLWGS